MGATTEVEKEVGVEIGRPAIRDGFAVLNITKVWGTLDLKHRGQAFGGGMTWIPDGKLPVGIPVSDEIINTDQLKVLFEDLIKTLMPSIKVFVSFVDGDEKKEDF